MKRTPDFRTPYRLSLLAHCANAKPPRGIFDPMPIRRQFDWPFAILMLLGAFIAGCGLTAFVVACAAGMTVWG